MREVKLKLLCHELSGTSGPFIVLKQECLMSRVNDFSSLTHHRLELLNLTQSYLQEKYYNKKGDIYPKFTFADVHGNLKLVLNQPFKNRSVFSFSSVCEFHQIINKVTTQSSYPYEDEIFDDERAEWLKLVVNVEGKLGVLLLHDAEVLPGYPFHCFLGSISQQHGVNSILQQSCMVSAYSLSVVITWCHQNSIIDTDLTPSWQYGEGLSPTILLLLFS